MQLDLITFQKILKKYMLSFSTCIETGTILKYRINKTKTEYCSHLGVYYLS